MIALRPYQIPAVHALAKCDLGYIKAPAGSGKSFVMASAVKRREEMDGCAYSVCILAPTQEIREQMLASFKVVGISGPVQAHCWQGLDRVPDCDILIIDEAHSVAAPCYRKLLRTTLEQTPHGIKRRCITWACTATPAREDGEDITPIIGPCVYTVPPEAVAEAGGVLPAIVRVVEFNDPTVACAVKAEANKQIRAWMNDEQRSRVVWRHVLRIGVTENRARLERIAEVANGEIAGGASVIALCDTVEMCKRVAELLTSGEPLYAGLGKKRREAVLNAFKRGELKSIVATSLADEGLDCPIASVMVLARAGKAEGRLTQRVGRVLRPYPGQAAGVVYDVCDKSHGMLTAQFWKRMSLYRRWGFRIEK